MNDILIPEYAIEDSAIAKYLSIKHKFAAVVVLDEAYISKICLYTSDLLNHLGRGFQVVAFFENGEATTMERFYDILEELEDYE